MRISSAAPGIQYFDPDIPYRWGIQGNNKFMSPHGVFSVLIRHCSNGRTRWLDGFAICQFCPAVPTTIRGRIGVAPNLPSSGVPMPVKNVRRSEERRVGEECVGTCRY